VVEQSGVDDPAIDDDDDTGGTEPLDLRAGPVQGASPGDDPGGSPKRRRRIGVLSIRGRRPDPSRSLCESWKPSVEFFGRLHRREWRRGSGSFVTHH
jgi:hypothetical protein